MAKGNRSERRGHRQALSDDVKRRKLSITLDPDTVTWLKTQRTRENEPLSRIVERLLTTRKEGTR